MRSVRFTILITKQEKEALDRLSTFWHRSRSDVLRLLLASALSQLFTETDPIEGAGLDRRHRFHGGTPTADLLDSLGDPQVRGVRDE